MFIKTLLRFALEVLVDLLRIAACTLRQYLRQTRHTRHASFA